MLRIVELPFKYLAILSRSQSRLHRESLVSALRFSTLEASFAQIGWKRSSDAVQHWSKAPFAAPSTKVGCGPFTTIGPTTAAHNTRRADRSERLQWVFCSCIAIRLAGYRLPFLSRYLCRVDAVLGGNLLHRLVATQRCKCGNGFEFVRKPASRRHVGIHSSGLDTPEQTVQFCRTTSLREKSLKRTLE